MSISEILQFASQVEKLGIIGLLFIVMGVEGWALVKYRKEMVRTFRQRDRARMISVRYKGALDNAGIKVDISDIDQMFKDDIAEEASA